MSNIDLHQYKRQLHSIDMSKVAALTLILTIASAVILAGTNILIYGYTRTNIWIIIGSICAMLFLFVLHEILHAFSFLLLGSAKTSEIHFGGNLNQGFLYCTCTKPISKNKYIFTILFPFIITLIASILVATIQNHLCWVIVGSILLGGCSGDLMMAQQASKLTKGSLVLDHPTAPAYYELAHVDNLPENFCEVTQEEEDEVAKSMEQFKNTNASSNKTVNKILSWVLLGVFIGFVIALIIRLV